MKYMRKFAQEYSLSEIGQQAVDQIPWGHILTLLEVEKVLVAHMEKFKE